MTPTPTTASAHAFVDDLDDPALDPADHHHLIRVLRLPVGQFITVSDGRGRWRPCRLTASSALTLVGDVAADPRPEPAITIGFALVKGERPELVVQKLTELGIDRIVPFVAGRSVVRWKRDRAARNAGRLTQVARQAAMQSRRTWLPVVEPVTDFAGALTITGAALADLSGGLPTLDRPGLLVGPEGGWTDEERAAGAAVGVPTVRLGAHVLRAETAAITGGAVLAALRGGLVGGYDPAQ